MKTFLRFLSLIAILFYSFSLKAQDVEMADSFRNDGKIYVVVLILSIICIGLFGYLYFLDKKISQIEKKEDQK